MWGSKGSVCRSGVPVPKLWLRLWGDIEWENGCGGLDSATRKQLKDVDEEESVECWWCFSGTRWLIKERGLDWIGIERADIGLRRSRIVGVEVQCE